MGHRLQQFLAFGRIIVGKSKQRLRSTLLKIGGTSNTSRSTLLRIFMRGMAAPVLKGVVISRGKRNGGENTISHNRQKTK